MKKLILAGLLGFSLTSYGQEEITCKQCDDILKVIRVYQDETTKELWVQVSTSEGTINIPEKDYKKTVFQRVSNFLKKSKFMDGQKLATRVTPIFKTCQWVHQLEVAKKTFEEESENK